MMRGYTDIKDAAKVLEMRVPDLLVLAPNNDPFYAGQPAQEVKARWFAALWSRFGYTTGVHLRRVHYQLVSQETPVLDVDGKPYENTIRCWQNLNIAGKAARYLGLVAADAFEDHRNPDPQLFVEYESEPEPDFTLEWPTDWQLPRINTDLGLHVDLGMPYVSVDGYEYRDCDQPYHLELWIEKSTMNDVLVPVCRRYGINLVTSLGFQSITSAVNLINRIDQSGKAARVFYISDFDPAGDFMPQSVARQIEYWIEYYGMSLDIKLDPLALTREQVIQWRLPKIPIKKSDRRRGNFESAYGTGAVELDALESLHPGELEKLIIDAVKPYRDDALESDLYSTEITVADQLKSAWRNATDDDRKQLRLIEASIQDVYASYSERLLALKAAMDDELAPIQQDVDSLRHDIENKIEDFDADLPARPESELDEPQDNEWLYDSDRDYFDQLDVYKARRGAA